jgi:hypothetical protein
MRNLNLFPEFDFAIVALVAAMLIIWPMVV